MLNYKVSKKTQNYWNNVLLEREYSSTKLSAKKCKYWQGAYIINIDLLRNYNIFVKRTIFCSCEFN